MKQKKIYAIILLAIILMFVKPVKVAATSIIDLIKPVEYTEAYQEYLKLPEEQKNNIVMPRMYDLPKTSYQYTNPLRQLRMVGSSIETSYTLQNTIPDNMIVRNQGTTAICWAFATMSSLESNLALRNQTISKVYDFSERHMDYATTKIFSGGVTNPYGFNRTAGSNGNWYIATTYLTNGLGAINEEQMPFQNNVATIDISQIQNKTVTTQIYDTVEFPRYTPTTVTEEIIQKMKEHIKNYGSIYTNIHGAQIESEYYNKATGAIYCDNTANCPIDHAVSIIGWDDEYPVTNFNSSHQPTNKGAWKIKNSWGSLFGENGFMYVSYEDVNVYSALAGIVKAENSVDYENIYQYNYLGKDQLVYFITPVLYLGNTFTKKTEGTEYVTQVAIDLPETATCKVYINSKGTSMAQNSLQQISLKSGDTQTLEAGYHVLEFLKPVLIEASEFAVVIECEGTNQNETSFWLEANIQNTFFDTVEVETSKCFITQQQGFETNQWIDLSKISELNSDLLNGDSTIKAFTVSNIEEDIITSIKIKTPPTKTTYIEGENFVSDGMSVVAVYKSGAEVLLLDYDITNGTNLVEGQTAVTISYDGKQVRQSITVEKNTVTSITIKTPPTKTVYKEGENFEITGMVIEATYKNGERKEITNYTIQGGTNLTSEQTSVTISYEGKQITQAITVEKIQEPDPLPPVEENPDIPTEDPDPVDEKKVTNVTISQMPTKTTYIQNKEELDLSNGMLRITYNDNTSEEIPMNFEEVTNTGFSNATLGKITVTLTYLSKEILLELEIIEEKTAQNSDFSKASSVLQKAKLYTFTGDSKKDYMLMNIQVKDIIRNLSNETCEYYYYLSEKQEEDTIQNWIKIEEQQNANNAINFTIDTNDIEKLEELSDANVLYLYIKEVAINGGDQKVVISHSMELEANAENIEIYIDNVRQTNTNNEDNKDNTIANGTLPQTGSKMPVIILIIAVIAILGTICYTKYKKINI